MTCSHNNGTKIIKLITSHSLRADSIHYISTNPTLRHGLFLKYIPFMCSRTALILKSKQQWRLLITSSPHYRGLSGPILNQIRRTVIKMNNNEREGNH